MARFMLVLWNTKALGKPPGNLRGLLSDEDKASTAVLEKKGVHVLSTFAYTVGTRSVEFWLRGDVIDEMVVEGEGWMAYVWRTDTWEKQGEGVGVRGALVRGRSWVGGEEVGGV